jgi:hypothetical protein
VGKIEANAYEAKSKMVTMRGEELEKGEIL